MGGFVDSSQCKWPLEQVVLIANTTITKSQGSQKSQKRDFCVFEQTRPKIDVLDVHSLAIF